MTAPQQTPGALLKQLVDVCESPTGTKSEVLAVVRELQRIPILNRASKYDPLQEALQEFLLGTHTDPHGELMSGAEAVSIASICEAMGQRSSAAISIRLGKMMSKLGYTKIPRTRRLPDRFRAPREKQ